MYTITETKLDLQLIRRGKVRDSYSIDNTLLLISTDRISAFDVVFKEGIPHKGEVLNKLSIFWFKKTKHIIENHFLTDEFSTTLATNFNLPQYLNGRSMIVTYAQPIRLECVVRGYLTGSAWKEYKTKNSVCGISLPLGLKDGSKLLQLIFTPSTKADQGHDENLTENQAKKLVGSDTYGFLKNKSLELYKFAHSYALTCGLVLADTKFEFGMLEDKIILIDEALTPDSSRYWLKEKYDQGILESLDKQFVRNYLEGIGWNKNPPPPKLSDEVIQKTAERYLETYRMLTGKTLYCP